MHEPIIPSRMYDIRITFCNQKSENRHPHTHPTHAGAHRVALTIVE